MTTLHLHRFTCIVPAARVNALNSWIANNLDSTGSNWLVLRLDTVNGDMMTHAWFSAAFTNGEFKKVAMRLCNLANIDLPANWDSLTRNQKKAWLISQRATIRTNTGIYFQSSDGDGVWDSPDDALSATNLQR